MTDSPITFVDDIVATKTAPPKRWRNKYMANWGGHVQCSECGSPRIITEGRTFFGHCNVWPSYDVAMTKGLEFARWTGHGFIEPVEVK